MPDINNTLSTKHICVGASNVLDVQRISCPNFPTLPEKLLYDKHSPSKLFCSSWYIMFLSTMLPWVHDYSVWPFRSGRSGQAVSITGNFGRDISVHKEMMKFVNVNEYLCRIIIYPYNTRQIKTRQFALPKTRSNSGAKMIKYSAIEISSKILSEIKNITCLTLFAAEYKKYVLLPVCQI